MQTVLSDIFAYDEKNALFMLLEYGCIVNNIVLYMKKCRNIVNSVPVVLFKMK